MKATRCVGYTLNGKRCKKTTSHTDGLCPQHMVDVVNVPTTPRRTCSPRRRVRFEEECDLERRKPIEMSNDELENEAILCLAKEAAKRGALVIMYRE